MSSFKQDLLEEMKGASESLLIRQKLDSLFNMKDPAKENRVGMHASAIIAADSEFCYRQQVLSFFFKNKEPVFPIGTKRVFAAGTNIHQKWQNMFALAGISRGAEMRGYSDEWKLLMTPDDIVEMYCKLYVVEIKSVNTYQFKHLTSHPSGNKQCHVYMHFYGIPNGFVLAEDKNTQDIKVFPIEYDPEVARPYVERLHKVGEYKERYETTGKLPSKMCNKIDAKRASHCDMCRACFNIERVVI